MLRRMSAVEKDTASQYAVEIRNRRFLHPTVLRRIEYWHQGSVAHLELTALDADGRKVSPREAQLVIETYSKRMRKHCMSDQKFRVEERKRLKAQRKAQRRLLLATQKQETAK
jgi:hypothetical protein